MMWRSARFGACSSGWAATGGFVTGVRHVKGAESMLLTMMIPSVLGPFWVWIVIDEVPSFATLAGGTLVLAALGGWAIRDLRT